MLRGTNAKNIIRSIHRVREHVLNKIYDFIKFGIKSKAAKILKKSRKNVIGSWAARGFFGV